MSDFTYLYVHTHFSRAGGPASPSVWCARARELGYTAIALADRSPLAGWPAMHQAAMRSDLGLIYGMEADIVLPPDGNRKGRILPEPTIQGALLLSRSPEGARNLAYLASVAYSGWPAQESAIPWDALAAHATGIILILLGGDESGALQPIAAADIRKAQAWATALKSAFTDSLYVGLPHSGRSGDIALAEAIASRAAESDLPLVALPPARYLQPGDAPAYEALKVARRRAGWPHDTANRHSSTASIAADRDGFDYMRSPDEVLALYSRWPQAIENTKQIANQAQHNTWPFNTPDIDHGHAHLLETAEKRLLNLLQTEPLPPETHDRLVQELGMTSTWGGAGAWTFLAALTTRAQDVQEPVPFGAPSNSLLTYALGLSRTHSTESQSPPDQVAPLLPGLTLPSSGRSLLLKGLSEEYGLDRVAYAACPLDITPVQALAASAAVLGLDSDLLRSLLLPAINDGWQALQNITGDGPISRLPDLSLALKGTPLTFVPDHDTALAAPRAIYASDTLASWSPILPTTHAPSTVHRPPSVSWSPWSAESLASLGYPAVHLPSSPSLNALHAALQLALRNPVPGLALPIETSSQEDLSIALKSQHPAAYFAGAFGTAWPRGEADAVAPIAAEARKLGVKLDPPHVNFSLAHPTLQRDGESWSIVWGLSLLPGWSAISAARFVEARPAVGFTSLAAVVEAALSSGLGIPQLGTLIMAGACDTLGYRPRDRHAMLSALPDLFKWAETHVKQRDTDLTNQLDLFSAPATPPPLEEDLREDNAQASFQVAPTSYSPHERYLRRQWERDNLGVTFTEADEMDALISALDSSGDLRSRLISTEHFAPGQAGTSIHIVGLLSRITLLTDDDGDTLAVGSLEDPNGTLELVAFPPNYKRHAPLWVENNLVAVTARVQTHPDGDLYLLCEHLAPFSAGSTEESFSITIKTRAARGAANPSKEAAPPAQSARPDLKIVATSSSDTQRTPQPSMPTGTPAFNLIISIPDADEDQPVIDSLIDLKRLLQEHPGADSVTIRVPYIRGKWTSASLSWGVRYSHQLETRLRRLLGDDAIAVIQLAS